MIRIPLLGDTPPEDSFPYRDWACIGASLATAAGPIPTVATTLHWSDLMGRWRMRWNIGRSGYRVRPGLYALGQPDDLSPVLVSANYKLSFDTLRVAASGLDAWLLVLDTKGINVWCAAGKGTFGTEELVRRVRASGLEQLVAHRELIVPQLGAVGVAAHEVRQRCGFRVLYGPVRASDLQSYLVAGKQATTAMRRVEFPLVERLILTPVELIGMTKQLLRYTPILFVLGGIGPEIFSFHAALWRGGAALIAGWTGILAGAVLVPFFLPWLPGRAFALKGVWCGLAVALAGCACFALRLGVLDRIALVCGITTVASWCAMHFTGASTFTSPSGVEKEMRRAIPLQLAALLVAVGCWIAGAFLKGLLL